MERQTADLLADREGIIVVKDISNADMILDVAITYDFQTDVRRDDQGKPDTLNQRRVTVAKTTLAVYPADGTSIPSPMWKKSKSQTTADAPFYDINNVVVSDPKRLDITPARRSKSKDQLSGLIDDFVKYLSKRAVGK
jgi:hypothetical protein